MLFSTRNLHNVGRTQTRKFFRIPQITSLWFSTFCISSSSCKYLKKMSAPKAVGVLQTVARRFSRTAVQRANVVEVPSSKFKALKENQKKFQLDDHTPIYIKGGFGDKFLCGVTYVLTAIGLGMSAEVLYKLSFPQH